MEVTFGFSNANFCLCFLNRTMKKNATCFYIFLQKDISFFMSKYTGIRYIGIKYLGYETSQVL